MRNIPNFVIMRIDKLIWCLRLTKTRSEASKLCEKGMIQLNGEICKSSKTVSNGAQIGVKNNPIWKTYKVINIPKSRIGAKLISEHLIETTSEEDLLVLKEIQSQNRLNHLQGLKGRPTKKNRRDIDGFTD